MNYTVEGYIGEFSLPIDKEVLTFKLIPTGDYLRELPDEKDANKKKRQILLVGNSSKKVDERNAVLVNANSEFSFGTTSCGYVVPTLVVLKTAKARIRMICDEKCVVTSVVVL